jgi:hypothetical protein
MSKRTKRFLTIVGLIGGLMTGALGCGGGSPRTRAGLAASAHRAAQGAKAPPADPSANETDVDVKGDRVTDGDDKAIFDFGHAAAARDRGQVEVLLKRYYTAAASRNGARGCSLLYSVMAESVVEDYGRPPGPPSLRGDTCAQVMSKYFAQQHRKMAVRAATVRVRQLRVRGNQGLAVLAFGREHRRYIPVRREHGTWKVAVFADSAIA